LEQANGSEAIEGSIGLLEVKPGLQSDTGSCVGSRTDSVEACSL
jgi:hypothetical protein